VIYAPDMKQIIIFVPKNEDRLRSELSLMLKYINVSVSQSGTNQK